MGVAERVIRVMDRILVIDDDVEMCAMLAEYLESEGLKAEVAHEGNVGLKRALSGEHSLIVLDVMLPGMNGLELATWLKQRHPTLPVIMVSGSHPDLEQMAPFVDATIGKGVPLRHILDRLQLLLTA